MQVLNARNTILVITSVHMVLYVYINYILFDNVFEHPDSLFYYEMTRSVVESWKSGNWFMLGYPEYVNITSFISYLLGPSRMWPELLNVITYSMISILSYLTSLVITKSQLHSLFVMIVVSIDPYMTYLSTQYLRDILIIFAVSLTVLFIVKKSKFVIIPILLLMYLRPLLGLPVFVGTLLFTRNTKLSYINIVIITSFILIKPLIFTYQDTNSHIVEAAKTYYGSTYDQIEDNQPHTDFYESRSRLNITDIVLFPYPWKADNKREIMFAGYMSYWYIILFLGVTTTVITRNKTSMLFILLGLLLILPLTFIVESQGPFIRWRMSGFYIMTLGFGISIYSLKDVYTRKRLFDITISSVGLLILLPIISVISIALYARNKKMLFIHERVGFEGKRFNLYKFITMLPNSDGLVVTKGDTRVTKIGKLLRAIGLDEIPQLINVLKGNMSLVGPRPLAIWEDEECKEKIANWSQRYEKKPGIFGLAQLNGLRYDNAQKLSYDIKYQPSLIGDTQIILKSLLKSVHRGW